MQLPEYLTTEGDEIVCKKCNIRTVSWLMDKADWISPEGIHATGLCVQKSKDIDTLLETVFPVNSIITTTKNFHTSPDEEN